MRRVSLLILLLCLIVPTSALAARWRAYENRALGFGVRYPGGWQVVVSSQLGEKLVSLTLQGRYSIQISILPVASGRNAKQMVARVDRYEARRGVTTFAHMSWRPTHLGGRFADQAVVAQQTEGGVALSQAYFLAPGRQRTFQIMVPVNSKHELHSISQFPVLYREILSTWRYL